MIGLIVTGHGHFATGLTTSLNLIAGDAKEYVAVDFESTDSTDDLAKKLKECLEDKNRYDSKEIQEFILNKYSWNDVVERTMKIYKEIKK